MLLIIPAIEIKDGRCVQMVQGTGGYTYTNDPVEMAKLWRKENSKSLHVTDVDGAREGRPVNFDVIVRMVQTVDIPIELGGGLRTFDDVKRAFDGGVYRVVVGTMLVEDPDTCTRVLQTFGASKVVLGIDAENGIVRTRGWMQTSGLTAISFALNAKALGFRRIVYTDIATDGTLRGPNFEAIKQLAETTRMRITASGGVGGLNDLLKLQELEPLGVDSVVIGRALYENKFACQGLWRLCESGNYPYTAKI
jgi:phosphoribosylformimino-5-aminoimidazole carboxamide ribotide isomerase